MAEFAKQLHLQKGSTEETAKIYSTADEAGSTYLNCTVGSDNGYIPLGDTTDGMATSGRVQKGSTTYSIKSQAVIPYNEQSWTTAGTYSWTCPSGVKVVRVAVCGGGGGCALRAQGAGAGTNSGTAGGSSSFNTLSVNGGNAGSAQIITWTHKSSRPSGGYWTSTCYTGKGSAGTGGRNGGLYRKGEILSGYTLDSMPSGLESTGSVSTVTSGSCTAGAGYALSFTASSGSYGRGASGTGTADYGLSLAGSGSGYYNSGYINVNPGTSYSVVVGKAGTSSTAGNTSVTTASTSGFVLIAYGGDIK